MLPLVGAILGFSSSFVPQIFKYFQDKQDKKHELAILDKQIEANKQIGVQKLEEINIMGDIEESKALYRYATPTQATQTGNKWIDGGTAILFSLMNSLISSVRPIVTYGIVGLYSYVKIIIITNFKNPTFAELRVIWTETDETILMTVLGHWFGNRVMQRAFKQRG